MSEFGYRLGRWHPLWHYEDWVKWTKTDEGKEHLENEAAKTKKLLDHRKTRINYEEELKRSDLSPYQRQQYRKLLNEQ